MRRHTSWLIVAVSLTLTYGCDSFNLFERFDTNGDLALELQKDAVLRGESIPIYPSGGVPPYSFAVFAADLYYGGDPGSVSGTTYTAGDAIGKVSIKLSDSDGHALYVPIVIQPPAPSGFTVGSFSGNSLTISWTYENTDYISSFWLYYSTGSSPFQKLEAISSSATSFAPPGLNHTIPYTFRLYAVSETLSGVYLSIPTPDESPTP